MEISCEGRRAVVTAGGSGIGRVIAETLAANGAAVFTCDIQPGLVEAVRSATIGAIEADVADPAQVDLLFEAAVDAMGGRRHPHQQRRDRRPHRARGSDRARRTGTARLR